MDKIIQANNTQTQRFDFSGGFDQEEEDRRCQKRIDIFPELVIQETEYNSPELKKSQAHARKALDRIVDDGFDVVEAEGDSPLELRDEEPK
eukprot:CAMPEP_0170480856 /NCGR_PEP_ID=MMETSP0208-20121228/1524_1 /TAXON_ID=197538 /ORGANISM="Strombidium inclinatum, Strain S3" /LENGTH=90 /DNA_ID=CAMNT_0010753461 /DNA_START=2003 /DNA_END=2275 /DNA_ORIENTATION=+